MGKKLEIRNEKVKTRLRLRLRLRVLQYSLFDIPCSIFKTVFKGGFLIGRGEIPT
jgi:hypothetical protein